MTVKQDKSRGTWTYVVDLPAVAGKRNQKRRRGYPTKKAAAEAERRLFFESVRQGTYVSPSTMTVAHYLIAMWLPTLAVGDHARRLPPQRRQPHRPGARRRAAAAAQPGHGGGAGVVAVGQGTVGQDGAQRARRTDRRGRRRRLSTGSRSNQHRPAAQEPAGGGHAKPRAWTLTQAQRSWPTVRDDRWHP